MSIRLDIKDKKLLWALDSNSRQTFLQLGKFAGLSKEAVFYRIKRLEDEKVILGYPTFVSLAKIGLMHIKILIKLQNLKKEKKEAFFRDMTMHKNTNWVVACRGTYDAIIGVVVRDLYEFRKIKEDLFRNYSEYLHSANLSIIMESNIFGRKYFLDRLQETKHYIGSQRETNLDRLDFRVLKLISNNTRMKATDIASRLNTTARIAAYRIATMEKENVIQKYSVTLNHKALGLSFFKAFIYLRTAADRKRLMHYLANQKNCIYNVEALGTWDLEPEFEVYSTEEYYHIMDEIEDRFGDIIKTMNTLLIEKEHKFVLLPERVSGKFHPDNL